MVEVTFQPMIGKGIQPWPGEGLAGVVLDIEGDFYVCVCANGDRFLVKVEDVQAGRCTVFRPIPDASDAASLGKN
jgi:hypothetical protein